MMDAVNGCFEFGAFLFIANHCRVLHRDKMVRGVSVASTAFFALWGLWNILYYPSLGQTWSFVAGLLVVAANCAWVAMMLYYRRREAPATRPAKAVVQENLFENRCEVCDEPLLEGFIYDCDIRACPHRM